jgi:restriction system protein
MAIPDFQSFFYPFLKLSSDSQEHSLKEMRKYMTEHFALSEEDKAEKVPSGSQTKFDNRIYWTKSYLVKAKVLESAKRGHFTITKRGLSFLKKFKDSITINDLKEFEEFRTFNLSTNKDDENSGTIANVELVSENKTPLEKLEESYLFIQKELGLELLEKIQSNTWQFFEDLVIDLMIKMGYGGSRNKVEKRIKRTNDDGIDGVISEDKLGLEVIYLQAKKWTKTGVVGRPEIQKFVGALHGQRARKGVFITTCTFAKSAYEYVKVIDPKVILIDGETLANLMIEYGLGTSTVESYQIKKIDLDYFEEE